MCLSILPDQCSTEKCLQYFQGQGGASCQLCTATHTELNDQQLVLQGFPINRHISDAIEMFGELEDIESFFSLPSNKRVNLTHEPVSTINITPASPLHSYTCVFRWFNLLIYHLNSGKLKWAPTSPTIHQSMIFVRNVVQERTGLKIDQPNLSGGTTSTCSVARRAFSTESQFIECVSSLVEPQPKEALSKLHTQISAILRIFNCDRKVNTNELGKLCKGTYLLSLNHFHGQISLPHCTSYWHTLKNCLAKLILALVLNASLKKAQRLVIN